jgi:hypothetical protein
MTTTSLQIALFVKSSWATETVSTLHKGIEPKERVVEY